MNYHIVAVHNSKVKKPSQLYKFNWEEATQTLSLKEIKSNLELLGVPTRLKNKYKVD